MPPDTTAPAAPASILSRLVATPRALLSVLAVWLLATLGVRPLLLPDEGRYANVAREMLRGDLLVPTLNGLPFFHKPPLMYWLDIAAMRLTDITPFAGRFASMLGAWLMGAALYFAMRRWHGARVASIALLLTATCPFFFLAGQYANHDMLVAGLICTAILAFARAVDEPVDAAAHEPPGGPRRVGVAGWAATAVSLRWLVVGWIACALAVLAKGLIGFVLPALVIGPWLLGRGRWRQMLKLLHPLGLLAFAIVAVPWFVAMQLRYPGFNDYFFMEQHFRRFALASFNNVHPFWFFMVVLPAVTVPWVAWLPAALRRAWKERGPLFGLYVWWVIAIVGFFSMPSSKLVGYVLPALAPWCALLALAVAGTGSEGRPLGGAARAAFALGALICVGVVAGLAWKSPKSNHGVAIALATQMAADDKVVMVDEYFYDLPFYADLKRPALIASDWDDPDVPRRDNWRKELFDAARFDPSLGKDLLRPLARLDELSCGPVTTWFVSTPAQASRIATLTGAQRVYADRSSELWRVAARSCS